MAKGHYNDKNGSVVLQDQNVHTKMKIESKVTRRRSRLQVVRLQDKKE